MIDLNELKKECVEIQNKRIANGAKFAGGGILKHLATEVVEAAEEKVWLSNADSESYKQIKDGYAEELADIIICVLIAAADDNIDIEKAVIGKVEKRVKMPTHSDFMRHDIAKLLECDRVILLPNWETSKGARAEVTVAEICEIPIERITNDDFIKMMKDYYREVKRGVYYTEQEVIKFREMQDRAWSNAKMTI